MFCKKCGNQVPENAKFCPKCGTMLDWNNDTSQNQEIRPPEKPQTGATSIKKILLPLALVGTTISVACGIILGTLLWLYTSQNPSKEKDVAKTETLLPTETKITKPDEEEAKPETQQEPQTSDSSAPVQEEVSETPISLPHEQVTKLVHFLDQLHQSLLLYNYQNGVNVDFNLVSGDLKPWHKARVLWVYECLYQDPRISSDPFNIRNIARKMDMRNIMSEIFGTAADADMEEFFNSYCYDQDSDFYYMSDGTGDFGSANETYLDSENVTTTMENGRLKISGTVRKYEQDGNGEYKPFKTFTGYFLPSSGTALDGYCFDQIIIQ